MNHGILHKQPQHRPDQSVQAHKATSVGVWVAIGAVAIAVAAMVMFLSTTCL